MTIMQDNRFRPRIITFSCNNCTKEFTRGGKTNPTLDSRLLKRTEHFCSPKCVYEYRRNMEGSYKASPNKETVSCTNCNKKFMRFKSRNKWKQLFCSKRCRGDSIKNGTTPMNVAMTEEVKRKISIANKGKQPRLGAKLSEESKAKIRAKAKERMADPTKNPMYGRKHSMKSCAMMSDTRSKMILEGKMKPYGRNFHKNGYFHSNKMSKTFFYRSSWENACMYWLEKNNQVFEFFYEPIRVPYCWDDGNRKYKRHYVPDFLITFSDDHQELWEIKPEAFWNNVRTKLKTAAAQKYCTENKITKFRLLSKKQLIEMKIM